MNNNIFHTTRVKLTLWYLLILMSISIVFSVVVYISLSNELYRIARREQQKVIAGKSKIVLPVPLPDPKDLPKNLVDPVLTGVIKDEYISSKNKLLLQLIFTNIIVLGISAAASYFLSAKTLQPIEEMLEKQKKFISDASHELRTPLTSLKTSIEVTLKMGEIPYKKIRELLESNLEDVDNLEKLTNKFLIIERFSKGVNQQKFVEIQFDDLVNACIKNILPKAEIFNIKISKNIEHTKLFGDKVGLQEVVNNLLDNAIKYNKNGGQINVDLYSKDNHIYFEVRDTGIGIDPLDVPHIFERFYRVDNSRSKSQAEGYGLGLSIVYEIVKQHNGKVNVESTLNKGSTFIVKLPL